MGVVETSPLLHRTLPVRGTQSFVGVMARIWKRPGLTGIEVLWRWLAGVPLLWLAWHVLSGALAAVPLDTVGLQTMTVFQPVEAAATISRQAAVLLPPLLHAARWLAPVMLVVWSVVSAVGRTVSYRRLDPSLRARPGSLAVLGLLRTAGLLVVLALWCWAAVVGGRYTVTNPAAAGSEPNLVLFAALVVGATLVLFLLWSVSVWVVDLATLLVMAGPQGLAASLRAAVGAGPLRSKLMETNLVLGIVKVALLVWSLVLSACPLPFQTVETQSFLIKWWIATAVLYLLASDMFHVIRRAAYLALFHALPSRTARGSEVVS